MHNPTTSNTITRQRNRSSRGITNITANTADEPQFKNRTRQATLVRFHTVGAIVQPPLLRNISPTHAVPQQLAKIIVGFPGIGKSFVSNDLSGQLSWLNIQDEPGYAKGAEDSFRAGLLVLAQQPGVLLLPAHRMIGNFLIQNNLVFTSVFPRRELKDEYLERYRRRGSSAAFVDRLEKRWNQYVDNMLFPRGMCNHVELEKGEFLKDVFLRILLQADARVIERL